MELKGRGEKVFFFNVFFPFCLLSTIPFVCYLQSLKTSE